jgi:large subunit ribosomal protein L20
MPKLKTKSGAKKRFKVTATGKVMHAQRGKRHGMIKRTKKQIRQLRGTRVLFKTDGDNVKKYFLPNACSRPRSLPPAPQLSRRSEHQVIFRRIFVMARVKRGVTAHAKHKKVYKAAKGFRGRRKNTIRTAKPAVEKALVYAFRDRKRKKRTFRALWIQRINAAVRPFGLTYSRFIDGMAKSGITVDRKVLSDLAINEPASFQAIAEKAKAALAA